jgi:tetratricopeptide (TPR) repeat protein
MAKELRAELHERFAAWLEQAASGRPAEFEELVGYHLEQAYRYRAELGPVDENGNALGRRAAERLAAAADRALNRGDRPAHANLLSRAVALLPSEDEERLEHLSELGASLAWMGEFARAEVVLDEAINAAATADNAPAGARARIARADLQGITNAAGLPEVGCEAEAAIPVLEDAGDDLGLAKAWALLGWAEHGQGQEVAAQQAWERAVAHARRTGSRSAELDGLSQLAWVAVWGPTPRDEALRICEEILQDVTGHPHVEAFVVGSLSCLHALEGAFDEARALYTHRARTLKELGFRLEEAWSSYSAGWVEMLAGDAAAAEGLVRPGYERLAEMGATAGLQVTGSILAQAVCGQGRFDEAERLALSVERLDPTSGPEVATALCVRAKAAARLGRPDEGERLARKAVVLIDRTEFAIDRADARMDLAEVLRLAGRPDEAAEVLQDALRLHEQKENLVSAERARALLDELGH